VLRPQFRARAFDSAAIACTSVVRVGEEYWMYYVGGAEAGSPLNNGPYPLLPFRAGLATSTDGMNWSRKAGQGPGGCILDAGGIGEWDEACIGEHQSFNPSTE
jgi:hypothetical protein